MQRAEQLVADGHDALEDRDFAAAVEAYENALSKCRLATGIARDHDLPQTWELDQRQETITTYLDNAAEQRDTADENRLETATQRLDRATRLAETAEQHVEVDDSVAAWEDIQQARDVVDDAFELLTGTAADTSEIERRASEIEERIETIAAELPEAVRMEGATVTASKRELITYLQELSVIFGESPRRDLIDAYGVYPAEAYLEVFGSWDAALDEANLAPIDEQARERRVYSRVDILDAIVDLAEEVGAVPTPDQMNDRGAVSTATVEKRFESWETAIRLTGLETEPTLDAVREIAGSGDATGEVQRDTEASGTDAKSTSTDQSEPVESEPESDTAEPTDAQGTSSGEHSAGESTEADSGPTIPPGASADVDTGEFADLTDFQRDLLVILAGLEGPKGLRIKEELETYYDDQINHGRLYPNLDTLVERGFVEKFDIDNRSNGYRLSDKGDRHVRSRWQWEDAHTPSADRVDPQEAELSATEPPDETAQEASAADIDVDASNTATEDNDPAVDDDVDTLIEDLLGDIDRIEDDDS
jgi:DNA-binding PadR family transcriptional regulator